jgi:hypothetical protein
MAGSPKRRARKLALMAAERANDLGITVDQALMQIEAETQERAVIATGPAKTFNNGLLPPGEEERLKLEAARKAVRETQAEWLIGPPDEIAQAYENRASENGKYTEDIAAKIVYLTRAGIPVRDSQFGPGSARQCGLNPATVWSWVHSKPEFGKAYREARDHASELLEDEMRAMLPTAMVRPDLLDSLNFIAGRLEWLAKARNPDRYGTRKADGPSQSVTFNINASPPMRDVTAESEKIAARNSRPASLGITIPSKAVAESGE